MYDVCLNHSESCKKLHLRWTISHFQVDYNRHQEGWAPVSPFPHPWQTHSGDGALDAFLPRLWCPTISFFISATVRGCEATAFTASATFCHSSAFLALVMPTLCPPNNIFLLFSTSPTITSTSHWVKLRFFDFLSVFAMISQSMNINLWAFHGLFMGNYGRDMKPQKAALHLELIVIY